jgi:hypothetical protein
MIAASRPKLPDRHHSVKCHWGQTSARRFRWSLTPHFDKREVCGGRSAKPPEELHRRIHLHNVHTLVEHAAVNTLLYDD